MPRDISLIARARKDSKPLRDLANELDATADSADRLDTEMGEASKTSVTLDRKLKDLRASVRELGAEFVRTGDKTIIKDLGKQRSIIAQLEKIQKELHDGEGGLGVTLGSAAGTRAGAGFGDGFLKAFGSMRFRSKAIAALVGVAVAASPAIGAMIGGAVTGAVGLGGIAGGIATAARDPQVREAAKTFSTSISQEFFAKSAFIQPTIEALDILERGFKDLDINEAFSEAAPLVDDIARGLVGMGKEFVPRFRAALAAARPVLKQLSIELPRFGAALGHALLLMAKSEGAVAGMHAAFNLINNTIVGTAQLIDFLGKAFVKLIDIGIEVSGFMEDVPIFLQPFPGINWKNVNDDLVRFRDEVARTKDKTEDYGGMMQETGPHMAEFSNQLRHARENVDALNLSLDELFGEELAVEDATIRYEQSLDDLTQSIRDNGKEWDVGTEKGRNNRQALLDVVKAAMDVRDAQLKAKGGTAEANKEYQTAITRLEKIAEKAGLSEQELQKLVKNYQITFTIVTKGRVPRVRSDNAYMLEGEFRARGGPVLPGRNYIFEGKPELLAMGADGRGMVYPLTGGFGTTGPAPSTAAATMPAAATGRQDDERIVRLFERALSGMRVMLDGQAVGVVQAGAANRYSRGG